VYYEVNGTTYRIKKNGSGPALLLLHGFTGSAETWKAFVEKWQATHTVLAIDLPGHAKTTSTYSVTMKRCCQDIAEILQSFDLNKVIVLGYSMGGRTGLSFACLYPDLVDKLILESASPGLQSAEERAARQNKDEQLAMMIEKDGVSAFVDFWEEIPLFASQKQLSFEKRKAIRKERLSHTADGLAMSLRAMGTGTQPSWWEFLERLSIPTLLLAGGSDTKFIKLNENMHKLLPQSDFRIIENAGHAIHVEQAEIFGKIVGEFIYDSKMV
jgi:2-succinyl-6-hydroxy-2,4-cyclohexadiene-1-carboxylate synthase